jgi:hypothetical protein
MHPGNRVRLLHRQQLPSEYAWVSTVIAPQLAASGIAGAELIIALLLGWDWNSD